LCVNKSQFVPVIFEPPCSKIKKNVKLRNLLKIWIPDWTWDFQIRMLWDITPCGLVDERRCF
jgi:hypothetical protein